LQEQSVKLGFIGVGTITEAVVGGLQHSGVLHAIHLSPRSDETSRRLAAVHDNIFREESNAAVVDKSDLVVLAMRPDQLDGALPGLRFRPDQIVVSFVAAVSCAEIAALVAPAKAVCRVTPLPPVERGKGPILIYPAIDAVVGLFKGLGEVIVPADEAEMRALACASGFMSSYFELQNALASWLVGRDVDKDKASRYVRSMLSALSEVALDTPGAGTGGLPLAHETKGGLNERVRRLLTQEGWFADAGTALASLQTLQRNDLTQAATP
jgi:pyrroline-5-carboxylate reductase